MSHNRTSSEIIDFWFSKRVKPKWFTKSAKFDREIKQRFLTTYSLAKNGTLDAWRDNPQDTLALIILLDQFPRNMFRNTPQAFATDEKAVELTKYAVSQNYQQKLSNEQQVFLYMPLMHSENQTDQAKCVELFDELEKGENLKFALKHQEVVERFGRFPHRNQILGRQSTTAEREFLTQPGSSF